MRKLLLLCLLLIPLGASAQGFHLEDNATQNVGGFEKPVPAVITVCTSTGTQATPASPCTPVTTIYSDAALTMVKTQSITADANGYYDFYVAPATYFYTICFAGRCATRTLTVPCVTGSSCGGGGAGVSTINGLSGAVILAAGANITLTPAGNTITIAATAGTGTPCTTTALSLQFNNAGSFGCVAQFTYSGSTLTGVSGTLTLTAMTAVNLGDTVTSFKNTADATKIGLFSASGITTGNTRTLSFPDLNGIIQVTNNNQFITGVNTFGSGSGITAQNGSVFNLSAANPLSGFLPPSSAGAAPVTLGVLAFDSTTKCLEVGQGGTTGAICPGGAAGSPGGIPGSVQTQATSTTFGFGPETYAANRAGATDDAKITAALGVSNSVNANFSGSPTWAAGFNMGANQHIQFYPGYFPTIGGQITMYSGDFLLGGGSSTSGGTIFSAKNALNTDLLDLTTGTAFIHWLRAEDFQLNGNRTNQASGNCLHMVGAGEADFLARILAQNCKNAAYQFTGNMGSSFYVQQLGAFTSHYGFDLNAFSSVFTATSLKGDGNDIFFRAAPTGSCSVNIRKLQDETSGDPFFWHDGTNNACDISIWGVYPGGGFNAVNEFLLDGAFSPTLALYDTSAPPTYTNVINDQANPGGAYLLRQEKFEGGTTSGPSAAFLAYHRYIIGDRIAYLRKDKTFGNGTTTNATIQDTFTRIIGPTAAFGFSGISTGYNPASCGNACVTEGALRRIYNPSVQTMSLVNEDTGSAIQFRILTNTGADIAIPGPGMASLIYHNNLVLTSGATPCAIVTNVNTCTVPSGHLFLSGQHINVASETGCGATINGEHTLTSVTATTIVWSQTAANQSCGSGATISYARWMPENAPWPLPTSSVGVTGTGTTGFIPKFTAAAIIGNSACDDGITTANTLTCTQSAGAKFTGPVTTGPDGVHPGDIAMVGNTTAATIAANTFNLMGPNVTTFTGYALQASSTAPTTGQCLVIGTVAAGVAPLNYNTCPSGSITGPGSSTNHGLATWNGTGGTVLESLNTQFTVSATNFTSGATGVVDLGAASATGGFKLPTVAGAVPTADGFAAFNSTIHALVTGSNGNTIVQAAAALGTTVSTTCTNQFFTVISAIAAPTCTTATLASAQFANQGTTITVLIGNAAGNPSFGSVNLATMITGQLPIGNVGSAGLSGTSPITIASTGVIACATCATGPGASTNHGLASWNGTGGLALESLNTQFTLSATNFTSGATGVVDLGAASATGGFKLPTVAGAAPTADGFVAFNSTTHAMVSGSNGTTVVGAAAATGTNTSTTCTNQVFTVISAVAAPTCTSLTAAFLPNVPLNQVISPTGAVATFADGDNALVFNSAATTSGRVAFTIGETTASTAATTAQLLRLVTLATSTAVPLTISQGSGVNATNAPLAVSITGGAGGANAGATNPGFKGGGVTAIAGNGSNAGATSGTGGAGGDITLTAGTGGTAAVASTTGAGGNIILTPGAAGGTGTAGLIGVVQVAGANAGFVYMTQGSANTTANTNIPTNSIIDQAPAAVTAYSVIRPGITATGVVTNNVASAVDTQGVSGDANHSATVTIGSGTSIGSTSLCSTANCTVGTYAIHVYVDITTACGTTGTYTVNLIYTDDQGSKTIPVNINGTGAVPATGVLTTTSTANFGENVQVIRSTGAASINYSTTAVACGTAGPMVGKLYLSAVPIM